MTYSILENGIMIEGFYQIGTMIRTQWGMRKVIGHNQIDMTPKYTEPEGC